MGMEYGVWVWSMEYGVWVGVWSKVRVGVRSKEHIVSMKLRTTYITYSELLLSSELIHFPSFPNGIVRVHRFAHQRRCKPFPHNIYKTYKWRIFLFLSGSVTHYLIFYSKLSKIIIDIS